MTANLKPAPPKAWALLRKLQALAERGIEGEKISAQIKLARLKARFDFIGPGSADVPDLFTGSFKRASKARRIYVFAGDDFDVANAVKWAIESATKIPCVYRNGELLAEATVSTAKRLAEIASQIALSFRALLEKFGALDGVNVHDRGVFVMGLYDGMMNEVRDVGQRLPSRASGRKKKAAPKGQADAHGLHVHPYTVGLNLGKQIRCSAPLEEITAELDAATRKHLTE